MTANTTHPTQSAQLDATARTDAAGNDNARQNRPQLTAHGNGHDTAQRRLRAITHEDINDLQRHNHAGKEKR